MPDDVKRVAARGPRAPADAGARRPTPRRLRLRRRALDPGVGTRAGREWRLSATDVASSGPAAVRTTTLTRRGWSLTGAALGLVVGSFLLGALEMLVIGVAALGPRGRGGVLAALPGPAGTGGQPARAARPAARRDRGSHRPARREPGHPGHPAARRHRLVRRRTTRRALPRAAARGRGDGPRRVPHPHPPPRALPRRAVVGGRDRSVRSGPPQRTERG